ncbi:MAG: MATE family efflux transporter [Lachnospiraceae bacterium]|nr:MATE family efflux transporter [Lachnospiraceae bacterium]
MAGQKSIRMTEGNIWKQILLFAAPLLVGNLFQQLYNTVDSIVVGNFVGENALAAVGSSNSLISLIVGVFMGLATGSGVIISQYYGGKRKEELERSMHTAVALGMIAGLALIFIGIGVSGPILKLMGTPEKVLPSSILYFRIYFAGAFFNLTYNMCAGILQAVGDSKSPLRYLMISSVTNVILDLLFVIVFHWGVAGVGIATITAQAVAMVLALLKLGGRSLSGKKRPQEFRLELGKLRVDKNMAKKILLYGIPSGLQMAIISLSNVVIQSNINSFGELAMAGCASYGKIDGFIMMPIMSFNMASMTFTGQNVGAGNVKRAKKGILSACILGGIYSALAGGALLLAGQSLLSIFTGKTDVVEYGMVMLRMLAPYYALIGVSHIVCGGLRGAGKTMTSMVILVLNLCVFRMIWVYFAVPVAPRLETVLMGYPLTWVTCFLCSVGYLWKGRWIVSAQEEHTKSAQY